MDAGGTFSCFLGRRDRNGILVVKDASQTAPRIGDLSTAFFLSLLWPFAAGRLCEEHPHEPWHVHMAGWQHLRRGSVTRHEARIWYVQVQHTARVLHWPLVLWQEAREGR